MNDPPDEEFWQMTPEAAARLDELYLLMLEGLAEDGGVWPEYTGDGQ